MAAKITAVNTVVCTLLGSASAVERPKPPLWLGGLPLLLDGVGPELAEVRAVQQQGEAAQPQGWFGPFDCRRTNKPALLKLQFDT